MLEVLYSSSKFSDLNCSNVSISTVYLYDSKISYDKSASISLIPISEFNIKVHSSNLSIPIKVSSPIWPRMPSSTSKKGIILSENFLVSFSDYTQMKIQTNDIARILVWLEIEFSARMVRNTSGKFLLIYRPLLMSRIRIIRSWSHRNFFER